MMHLIIRFHKNPRRTQLGRVVTGKTPPTARPELFGNIYPFITPTDVDGVNRKVKTERFLSEDGKNFQKNLLLSPKSTCFVCIGATIGKMCLIEKPSFTNQQINSIVVNEELFNPFFIYYAVKNISSDVRNIAGGAATPIVNKSSFSDIEINVPPLPIQHRIASILSAYDDLIENNTRRIAILEEMARRIYEEWFVKFKFPGHEKVKMVDSELGKIPEGWKVSQLGDVIELAYGKALKTEDRKAGDFPVYGSSGIVGYHSDYLIEGPGIIVGRKGNVGSVHWSDKSFFPIDTVFYVKTKLSLYYLFFNLKRQNFINNDAAVPGLNRNQAHALPIIKPNDVLIESFNKMCEPIFCLLRVLTVKNANLRTTRDFLLPKLISGEIDVSSLPEPEEADA